MDKIASENLFLLEFLVDNVHLDPKCDCESPDGELCVSFQFLDNSPLDICEADFSPKRAYNVDNDTIKSGKSCLFALTPDQANTATEQFDVFVTVMKKMPSGWLPEKLEMGAAIISISNLFMELINSIETEEGTTPTAKTLKDVFDINTTDGKLIGKIGVYIRMSCFGKLIVTQFQMNLDEKTVLFKDKEGKSLYRYKKAGKGKSVDQGYPPQEGMPRQDAMMRPGVNPNCPKQSCPINSGPPMGQNSYPNNYDESCPGLGSSFGQIPTTPYASYGQMPNMMTPCEECGCLIYPAPCLPPTQEQQQGTDGNYQEIGATMGGNSLTIRVHKDRNTVEPCCPAIAASPGNNANTDFAMQPGVQQGDQKMPFTFRMSGNNAGQNGGDNVIVNAPVSTAPDGTKYTEITDPNKELFILKIGKKSEGVDKKANLELELCTPRGPELKPIPMKETRETQYDEKDCPEEGKKGKAGKGKKGGKDKGKGKGKGKKK